ncbi:MAG: hypothetical protein U9O06_00780 [Euryarchaeota archaeon]|nr:hypothetical protein [Euryarchaeota archaeon]
MADSEFPEPQPGPSWEQLRVRLACSAGVAVVQLAIFWEFVIRSLPLLWPPMEPLSQWATFLMISAGSFIVISGFFGTLIGDQIYKRYLADDR